MDWSEILQMVNPNDSYDLFLNKIISFYDCAFPVVIIKKVEKARKPWITSDLLQRIKARKKLYHAFILSRDLSILQQFKKVRNKLGADVKKSRIRYYTDKFADICYDPQKTWRTIKGLLQRTPNSVPTKLKIGDATLSGKALANEFNRHFINFGAFDQTSTEKFEKYIKHNLRHTMFLHPTTPTEIVSLISDLKNSSSSRYDEIKTVPIKVVSDLMSDVVCHITNMVLSTGIFPEKMKIARISVFHKGGAVDSIRNYWPISILPLFSKIVEKVINLKIINHLHKYILISANQYGFQRGKSTESALLNLREKLISKIENQSYTIGIFVDFNKAFDSIKHNILFYKLPHYGIRGLSLNLLRSYLSNRIQFVIANNIASDTEYIKFIRTYTIPSLYQ